jgi:cytoskeleton protein RodZ
VPEWTSSEISGVPKHVLEIGSSLREARRRRGVELSEASAATLIRARYLEALESERFDVLPEGPYLRSFLREYAEYLGLDGDILVTELMARSAPPAPEAPETPAFGGFAAFLSNLPRKRSVLALLTLAAVVVALWQLGGSSPTTVQPPQREAIPSKPVSAPSTHAKPSTSSSAATQGAASSLALAAVRGPCWLLARIGSGTGPVIEEHTLQQGQTIRFGLKRPLWIRLGAPWNVDASIGSRSVTASLPAVTGNVLVTARGVTGA